MSEMPLYDPSVFIANAAERRAAIRAATERKAEERRHELQQLNSSERTPGERLHELKLPKSLEHPLNAIIAADTSLTIDEIDTEQRGRRAPDAAIRKPQGERSD
jgi:hypothetical protein